MTSDSELSSVAKGRSWAAGLERTYCPRMSQKAGWGGVVSHCGPIPRETPRHTCRHVLRWHLLALPKIEGTREGMGVSGPMDGRDQEPLSLGKRNHTPGPGTSTTYLIDSHFSFPKAHLALTILAPWLSLSEYRMMLGNKARPS